MPNFINKFRLVPCIALILSILPFTFFDLTAQQPKELSSPQSSSFETAIEDKEDNISNWEARLELARVLSYLKRYDESMQEYQKLIQAQPQSIEVRREMAAVLFYLGKTDESLQDFLKIPPQEMDDKSWIILADIYRKKKNYSKAEEIYFQYLRKIPTDDKVRLKLAELLSWQKRYDESIRHYLIILSHRPQDIQVRRRYAQVLTWMGEDEEAVKEWKKTLP